MDCYINVCAASSPTSIQQGNRFGDTGYRHLWYQVPGYGTRYQVLCSITYLVLLHSTYRLGVKYR